MLTALIQKERAIVYFNQSKVENPILKFPYTELRYRIYHFF